MGIGAAKQFAAAFFCVVVGCIFCDLLERLRLLVQIPPYRRQANALADTRPCEGTAFYRGAEGPTTGLGMGLEAAGRLMECMQKPFKNAACEVNEIGHFRHRILSRRNGLILPTIYDIRLMSNWRAKP